MAHWRIVRDIYCGYEVQCWRWYWPFWIQPSCNTHSSIEKAELYAQNKARKVVKNLGKL